MSYTVLARRYRSANFDEIIGQEQIAHTLRKAIETERIAHAFLFCGARGTGKTSTARILAKCLNCMKHKAPTADPCGVCDSCQSIARGEDMDVIEIDAASNTGVDNVRDLISNAQFRPARARFKVYIIDEVHMLSKNAFNALLKTLEEPPSHVKFILATTEPEKVLATILSRCQRYDFRNISTAQIAAHLKKICKQEKTAADEESLLLVAKSAAGSMRDALSLLERLLSSGESKLTVEIVERLMGLPKSQEIYDLAQSIGQGDVAKALGQTATMLAAGMSSDSLLSAMSEHLRNLLILKTCGDASGLVEATAVSTAELKKQSESFDAVALTQDIVILEELRRQLRQGHGGRALLDATLVRLALAEQFASVGELLDRLQSPGSRGGAGGGGAGAASSDAQKKKPVEVTIPSRMSADIAPPMRPAPEMTPRRFTPAPVDESVAVLTEAPPKMRSQPLSPSPGNLGEGRREGLSSERPRLSPMPVRAEVESARSSSPPPAAERPSSSRISPELQAEVEQDPVVRAFLSELSGQIRGIE